MADNNSKDYLKNRQDINHKIDLFFARSDFGIGFSRLKDKIRKTTIIHQNVSLDGKSSAQIWIPDIYLSARQAAVVKINQFEDIDFDHAAKLIAEKWNKNNRKGQKTEVHPFQTENGYTFLLQSLPENRFALIDFKNNTQKVIVIEAMGKEDLLKALKEIYPEQQFPNTF